MCHFRIQLISESTRVTEHTSTLIDHFLCNCKEMYSIHGVLDPGISDHSMVYAVRKKPKIPHNPKFVWTRSYRLYKNDFYEDMCLVDWSDVLDAEDVNEAVNLFYLKILAIIDRHAPYNFVKIKDGLAKWVTNEFLGLLDDRRDRMKRYKKYRTPENWEAGQAAIKLAKDIKVELQRNHVEETLNNARSDSKEMWKALKELWPLKNKTNNIKSLQGHSEDKEIANILNEHFSTVGSILGRAFGEVNYEHFLPTRAPIFNLTETN